MDATIVQGILDSIPFQPDPADVFAQARIRPGSEMAETVLALLEEANAIAHPRAAYRLAYLDARGEDWVMAGGATLTSRVLRINLETAQRVFVCLATSGVELDAWAHAKTDLLERYYADSIQEMAVQIAMQALNDFLNQRFQLAKTGFMSPGSLEDWPLEQQRPLFDLLNGLDAQIGVRLTENYLMLPVKSVSGLRFPTEESFVSCQLCPRPACPNRRAPYEPDLYARRFCA